VTWTAIIALAVGTFVLKALGLLAVGDRKLSPRIDRIVGALPAALIAALVVVQSVQGEDGRTLDARVAAVGAALVAVAFRAPFLAVVLIAMGTAAGLRLLA